MSQSFVWRVPHRSQCGVRARLSDLDQTSADRTMFSLAAVSVKRRAFLFGSPTMSPGGRQTRGATARWREARVGMPAAVHSKAGIVVAGRSRSGVRRSSPSGFVAEPVLVATRSRAIEAILARREIAQRRRWEYAAHATKHVTARAIRQEAPAPAHRPRRRIESGAISQEEAPPCRPGSPPLSH